MVKLITSSDTRALGRLLARDDETDPSLARRVAAIVADVRRGGDRALMAYARRFDRLDGAIELTADEIAEGAKQAPAKVRRALAVAARHIRRVAKTQVPRGSKLAVAPGVTVEQRVTPLERVGCYVPGGRYPLPSSLLMTAIPARIAGVREVIVACPRPEPAVLAAAMEAGVTRLFRMGGAHAIAALAYGTASVPRVDKIVGPGNAYVASAKAIIARDCSIDFYAGPSEIIVVSTKGVPEWIAADLMAQAEHDPDARAILLTSNKKLATRVRQIIEEAAPADGPTRTSLRRRGGIVLTRTPKESIAIANQIAPEHLVVDDAETARAIVTAGATFVGDHSAQAAGDYATGSNHVLPTNGAARFRGGLSAADFVRVSSVQTLTRRGLAALAPAIVTLAEAEGLTQHARSITVRVPNTAKNTNQTKNTTVAVTKAGTAARPAAPRKARKVTA